LGNRSITPKRNIFCYYPFKKKKRKDFFGTAKEVDYSYKNHSRGTPTAEIKRSLLALAKQKLQTSHWWINNWDSTAYIYTPEYIELTKGLFKLNSFKNTKRYNILSNKRKSSVMISADPVIFLLKRIILYGFRFSRKQNI
jgi:hypothetical protein